MAGAPGGETLAGAPAGRACTGWSETVASHWLSLGERFDGRDSRAWAAAPRRTAGFGARDGELVCRRPVGGGDALWTLGS